MRMEPLSLQQLWIVIFVTLCITRSFHGIVGANGDGTGVRSNDDYQSKNSPGASMDNKKAGETSESTSSSKAQGGHHHRFNSLVHNSTLMFDWRASDWSECKYRDSSSCCDCYKHRNISCVFRETGEQIPPFYCRKVLPVTPHNEEKCSPCQQPCVMSLWSPWSECSATCSPAIRHRTRAVLLPASHGGEGCGDLLEVKPCDRGKVPCRVLDPRPDYEWKILPWSSCRKPNNTRSCGQGLRTRQVHCINKQQDSVSPHFCRHHLTELEPADAEPCDPPCDCRVTHWSSWGPCSATCRPQENNRFLGYQVRTRSVRHPGKNGGLSCPHLRETRECRDTGLPYCPRYEWHLGDWGECYMPNENTPTACGSGIRRRDVICVLRGDESQYPLEDILCLQDLSSTGNSTSLVRPAGEETCKVPCPSDCQLGEWQNWSACTHSCGTGGVRVRQKPILMPATRGGEECGDRFATKPCEEIACQWWHIGQWTRCFLSNFGGKDACGEGTQVRNVYCINSLDEVLPDANCSAEIRPPTQSSCRVPCADDCQVSEWSVWGQCSATCGATGGVQERTRYITGNVTDPPCLGPEELRQSRICNRRPCRTFLWQPSPWSPCIRMGNASAPCGNGTGIQTRSVHCEMDPGYHVNESLCEALTKPAKTRICSAPCPEDCRLSQWSLWSRCSHSCGFHSYKVRTRRVLKLAMYGGTACPPQADKHGVILQKKRCKKIPECHTFHWEATGWTACLMLASCGHGGQQRNISCVRSDGKLVKDDACYEMAPGAPPRTDQPCFLPCAGDCELSQWTRWSTCSQTCGINPSTKTRTRYITKLDPSLTAEIQCPHLQQSDMVETLECGQGPCPEYSWVIGDWGSCIVHRKDAQDELLHCGHGIRRRHVICQRTDGVQVPHHHCDAVAMTPEKHQPCSIACPEDCQVSDWANWDPCSAKCGQGYRARRREVTVTMTQGGRPCPHLVENSTCSIRDCGLFEWKAAPWGPCKPFYDIICGRGERKRAVTCRAGAEFEEECERITPRPLDTVACDLPCLGDCVMTDWSEWSKCSCRPNATRWRHRNVTKEALPSAFQCGELEEEEMCYCPLYSIVMGDWTSCMIEDDNRNKCGQGVRKRPYNCVREDGVVVNMSHCEEYPAEGPTEEECEVPCPVDCEVSKFTPWSHCSAECGLEAYKERLRSVLTPANAWGRPCPTRERLVQNTTCHTTPCYQYSWERGQWSECSVADNGCGVDIRTRVVQCVRSDGMVADEASCFNPDDPMQSLSDLDPYKRKELDLEDEELCGEPCPGDCEVSTWSRYGPCFKDCATPGAVSIQVRTRVVLSPATGGRACPSHLMEVRPCRQNDVLCPTFYWTTGAWNKKDTRKVHCMAHEHLEVSGGCQKDIRPSFSKQCRALCGQYARCVDGSCSCRQGFTGDGHSCLPEYGCEDNGHCVVNTTYCDVLNKECLCPGGVLPDEALLCPVEGAGASGLFDHSLSTLVLYIIIGSICSLVILALICTICLISRRRKKPPPMDTYPNLTKIDNLDTMQKNNELRPKDREVVIIHKYGTANKNFNDDSTYDLSRSHYQSNLKAYTDSLGRKDESALSFGLKDNLDTKMCLLDPDDDLFGSHSDSSTKPLMEDPDYVPMFGANSPGDGSTSTNSTSPGTPKGFQSTFSHGRPHHNPPHPQMGTSGGRNRRAPPLPPPNSAGPRSGGYPQPDRLQGGTMPVRKNTLPPNANNPGSSRSLPRQHSKNKSPGNPWKMQDNNNLRTLPKPPKKVWFPQVGDSKPELSPQQQNDSNENIQNTSINPVEPPKAVPPTSTPQNKPNKPPIKPKPVMNGGLPQKTGHGKQTSSPVVLSNGHGPPKDTLPIGNGYVPNGDVSPSSIDDYNQLRNTGSMTPNGLRYPQPPPRIEDQHGPAEAGNRLMEYCDELLQELETMSKA